jgi:mannose-1-phosphate guanylyltransferase/phosphomannomutase
MIERGIIAGLLSAGVNVGDLRGLPIPIVRHEICNEGGAGGIYIRQSPRDVRAIDIKFFNSKGADISLNQEKAIEQLFFGEDFKRADMGHVGEVTIPQQTVECYKTCYLSSIKKDVLKKTRQKIVIDYAYSSASVIFPAILDELEVDVVALNAFINSSKITKSSEEFYSSLRQLSDIVTTLKANAGFLIDTGAEKLFLVDDNGKIIQDDMAMFIISYLVMKINRNRNIKIAVPINASSVIDKIAARFGVKVKRTATSSRNLMTVENEKSVVLVCDSMGGFIFPEFQNAFDAMYAIGKVIEMTAKEELSISEIMSKIPYFEVLHETVSCSWDKKGQTMRKALEEVKDKKVELVDGIKIYLNNSWVLFVPDPDEALFHIWAEAKDTTTTLGLLKMYVDKIKNWQK